MCVGFSLGKVPCIKFILLPIKGKLCECEWWWALGEGPGSLLGGNGGGELSLGGRTGASGACFNCKQSVGCEHCKRHFVIKNYIS